MVVRPTGQEAIASSHMLWSDALDAVHEAACDGHQIEFVHHIRPDGQWFDRTAEALAVTKKFLFDHMRPLASPELLWIRNTFGADVANEFECEAS